MKSALSLLLTLILLLGLSLSAWGDIAYEPADSFYKSHRDECDYENRGYYTNGSVGFATGYDRPGGVIREIFPNGRRYTVSWIYGEGEERWGCIEYDPDTLEPGYDRSCWLPMEQLMADYDSEAFFADHGDEIREESAVVVIPSYQEELVCWRYPGSGEIRFTIGGHAASMEFTNTFTDPAGRRWGYRGYYQGYRQFWVCLDDPFDPDLAPDENAVDILARLTPAASPELLAQAEKDANSVLRPLIFAGVGVAALAGGVLGYALKRKNRA